jgi:hypothetical protein
LDLLKQELLLLLWMLLLMVVVVVLVQLLVVVVVVVLLLLVALPVAALPELDPDALTLPAAVLALTCRLPPPAPGLAAAAVPIAVDG